MNRGSNARFQLLHYLLARIIVFAINVHSSEPGKREGGMGNSKWRLAMIFDWYCERADEAPTATSSIAWAAAERVYWPDHQGSSVELHLNWLH